MGASPTISFRRLVLLLASFLESQKVVLMRSPMSPNSLMFSSKGNVSKNVKRPEPFPKFMSVRVQPADCIMSRASFAGPSTRLKKLFFSAHNFSRRRLKKFRSLVCCMTSSSMSLIHPGRFPWRIQSSSDVHPTHVHFQILFGEIYNPLGKFFIVSQFIDQVVDHLFEYLSCSTSSR